jgi:hypothetical protein
MAQHVTPADFQEIMKHLLSVLLIAQCFMLKAKQSPAASVWALVYYSIPLLIYFFNTSLS